MGILLTDDALLLELVGRLRVERVRCLQKPVDLERNQSFLQDLGDPALQLPALHRLA